jgi:Ala-tRNA(Pro) deacylase
MLGKAELLHLLKDRNIPFKCEDHAPVFGMSDSAQLVLSLEGVHCKNLLLKNKAGHYFLVVTTATKSLDLSLAAIALGSKRLSFASADELLELLGVRVGSLSPLALINDEGDRIQLIIDAELFHESAYIFHPIENNASISLSRVGLDSYLASIGKSASWLELACRRSD